MKISIGIDIGGSTTKAVAADKKGNLIGTLQVSADDPRTCTYGILGRILKQCNLTLKDVDKIVLTGLGSTYFQEDIYGIPTVSVPELSAIGRGGLALSGLSQALVVSMGTGTAFVKASLTEYRHLGGSGIGGGTLCGLAARFLGIHDVFTLSNLASQGDRTKADLRIGDLLDKDIPSLNSELTASNFGKIKSSASAPDLAAALFNMIYENIGVMAAFALSDDTTKDVVLTGSLACLPQAETTFGVFNRMQDIFGIHFIIPPNAAFSTAIGALLSENDS